MRWSGAGGSVVEIDDDVRQDRKEVEALSC